ncbi:MAG: hypothetical protein IH888_08065 [Planctomycetes bacterium]|nr:hypothetical protein [Planctomycetota bacterium]
MRVKTGSLIVACGLAVVTFAPMDAGALACPPSNTKQAAVVQAVDAQSPSSCWKKRQVANVIVAGDVDVDGAARCPLARRASWIAKVAGSNANPACSKQYAVKFMAKALGDLRKGCSPDCTARADLVASVRTIAKSNPDLVFDAFIDVLTGNTTDGSAARVASVAYVSDPSQCRAAKAKARAQARTVAAVGGTSAGCRAARKAAAAALVVADSADPTPYVAFGCRKTDRIARAAARSYIDMMRELKLSSGAEGCSAAAASKVLASILDEMRADRAAAASDEAPQATPVSLGAVRDVTDASTPN